MNAIFTNRRDAGQKLAQQLSDYANRSDAIVLGLPRGGVPVAYEIANSLNLPLDVCLVRKLGLPNSPETAMGAVAEDALIHDYSAFTIIDRHTIKSHNLKPKAIEAIAAKEKAKLRRRESCYRHYRPILTIANSIIILVDDGMATGLTMRAAVEVLDKHNPAEIIVASPVASRQAISKIENLVDNLICLLVPQSFGAVGFWYEDFNQISDREVCNLLERQTCHRFTESN